MSNAETVYTIFEKPNFQSRRAPSSSKGHKSLTAAKRYASRGQVFHGTVLVIVDESRGMQVAQKAPGCRWETSEWARP